MAFFNSIYRAGDAACDELEEVARRPSPKKPTGRPTRPEPIITRGCLSLVWVNPRNERQRTKGN